MTTEELFDKLVILFDERFEKMNERFEKIEKRLDILEQRLDTLEQRLDVLEKRISSVEKAIKVIPQMQQDILNLKLTQENTIIPQLREIQSCYIDTYKRYQNWIDTNEKLYVRVDVLEKVVSDHSQRLQNAGI